MLKLINISKTYNNGDNNNNVLLNVNLKFKQSTINTIFGNSGTGKTTLLNILGMIDSQDEGDVFLNNKKINIGDSNVYNIRLRNFGYIFQNHYLLPEYTINENLMLPNLILNVNMKNIKNKIDHFLIKFDIKGIKNRYPDNISVGEAQRIAVIRALMNDPQIIIADEPTSNLDDDNSKIITDLFKMLNKENGYTFIIATHDKRFLNISNNNFKLYNKNVIEI